MLIVSDRTYKWDMRGIALARHLSRWSKDPSTQVGAVIMDARHRPVSWGYNGLPAGIEDSDERLTNRETKLALTLHAEHNAILFSSRDVGGCALYVWPFPPCSHCAAIMVQKRIGRIVVGISRSVGVPERWVKSFGLSKEILTEAGIDYAEYIL